MSPTENDTSVQADADADGDGPVEAVTAPAGSPAGLSRVLTVVVAPRAWARQKDPLLARTFAAFPWGEAIGGVERSLGESENRFPSRLSRATRQDYRPRGN